MKRILVCLLALLLCAPCALAEGETGSWLASMLGGMVQSSAEAAVSERSVGVIYIDGEISRYDHYYDHYGTLEAIDALAENPDNAALLLVMNTPGGSLYDADELYHEIMQYKRTGRSVYAYMEEECCSAGVYVAMAADTIMASRMTITGNVGVYMQTYSEAGLYELLGIESEYIATGENKIAGYPELTQEQRDIYQALVDESFGFFKQAIAESRALEQAQMEPFLDGRLLSALQAQQMGLIDEVLYLDEAEDLICARLEEEQGMSVIFEDVTPEAQYGYGSMDMMDYINPFNWIDTITEDVGGAGASSEQEGEALMRMRTSKGLKSKAK